MNKLQRLVLLHLWGYFWFDIFTVLQALLLFEGLRLQHFIVLPCNFALEPSTCEVFIVNVDGELNSLLHKHLDSLNYD